MKEKVTIGVIKGICKFNVFKVEHPDHKHIYHVELFFNKSDINNQYFNLKKAEEVIKLIETTKLTIVKVLLSLGGEYNVEDFTNEHREMITSM